MLTAERDQREGSHCPHADVIERIHASELRLAQLEDQARDLRAEVKRLVAWVREDSRRSAWLYDAEADLREVVATSRWATFTQRFVVWLIGAATGFLLFWEAAERWFKEHFHG